MFNVGDTVKLTGAHWDCFDLKDAEVTVTGISLQRDPQFTAPDGYEYSIFTGGVADYSATLVRAAEVTTADANQAVSELIDQLRADQTVAQLRFYIGNLRYARYNRPWNEFNKGRLEAFEDALQMLTGNRGEDIK